MSFLSFGKASRSRCAHVRTTTLSSTQFFPSLVYFSRLRVWCRFLLGLHMPVLFYVGLPVMWDLRDEDREDWAKDFYEILLSRVPQSASSS